MPPPSKEARWDKMSHVFPQTLQVHHSGRQRRRPGPETNARLRVAIANAKAQNLSRENIDSAIKRAVGKDAADIVEVNYEGKGPHGTLFFIECATDNSNRTVTNLKTAFNKNGGRIVLSGSLDFLFSRKTVIEFPESAAGRTLDEIELELIDAGLEELTCEDGVVTLVGDYTGFARLSQALEALGITATKAGLRRISNQPVELDEDQLLEVEKILDLIKGNDDVQEVFTNIA